MTINLNEKELKELQAEFYNNHLSHRTDFTTEKVAQIILNNTFIKTLRNDDKLEMWIYDDGIYKPNAKSYIEEMTKKLVGVIYKKNLRDEVINKIRATTYIDQEEFFNKQNEQINIVPVKNGLLNVETLELKPFSPNVFFFNKLSIRYNPRQECINFKKFLNEILENEEDILAIQELFGFCLLREYRFEKAFMLLGNGRNGKSKLLEVLKMLVGIENTANLSLQRIEKDKFSLCELHNKLVNISGDISKEALNNTGDFKELTGRGQIHASRKFKTGIKFISYAKMIFGANELPPSNDLTDAFFQRWEIIRFPFTFYDTIDYDLNKESKFAKRRNPNILLNIATEKEMEGILNWALEGLKRLNNNKTFSSTKSSESVKQFWIRTSDSACSFIDEMIVDDYGDNFVSWGDIKVAYKHYCKANNIKIRTDLDLRRNLINRTTASATRHGPTGTRGYEGIKLVFNFVNPQDKILALLKERDEITYRELSDIIPNNILDANLQILSQSGIILEIPKGRWRLVK